MSDTLIERFNDAVAILEEKLKLRNKTTEWRKRATSEGLPPSILLELAKEHLRTEAERQRAAERAEVKKLYSDKLGLEG